MTRKWLGIDIVTDLWMPILLLCITGFILWQASQAHNRVIAAGCERVIEELKNSGNLGGSEIIGCERIQK